MVAYKNDGGYAETAYFGSSAAGYGEILKEKPFDVQML